MASERRLPPDLASLLPPARGLPAALLLTAALLGAGCGLHHRGGQDARSTLEGLFPEGAGAGTLRGEAEITLSLRGRSLSLPGAVLLGGSGNFRIDLLDPLDRPAAVVFSDAHRVVQYRPSARAAAALAPLPEACRTVRAGGWVPFVLGQGPPGGGREKFETLRWFGGDSLVKYEWGTIAVKIEYRTEGGDSFPSRVSWYCGEEVAMRLRYGEGEVGGDAPARFLVEYPRAGLKIELLLRRHETGMTLPEALFRPSLPAGTRWQGWDLVEDGPGEMR